MGDKNACLGFSGVVNVAFHNFVWLFKGEYRLSA